MSAPNTPPAVGSPSMLTEASLVAFVGVPDMERAHAF
jgi:hypothetical protein